MSKTGKGKGKSIEDDIEDIFGANFRTIASRLENNGYNDFLCKNFKPEERPPGSDGNDLHPMLANAAIGLAAGAKILEKPRVETREYYDDAYTRVNNILTPLISSGGSDIMALVGQFLYQENNSYIKYLVPGFHEINLDHNVVYPTNLVNAGAFSKFVNIVRYLYLFIALLDPKSNDGKQIISFLIQDLQVFHKIVDEFKIELTKPLMDANIIPNDTRISEALASGLYAITTMIIKQLHITGNPPVTYSTKKLIDNFNGKIDEFIANLGFIDPTKTDIITHFNALGGIRKYTNEAAALARVSGDQTTASEYNINGLYNPSFIDSKRVADKLGVSPSSSGSKIGAKPVKADMSVPFLYDPKGILISVDTTHGANDQLVDEKNVTTIKNLIQILANATPSLQNKIIVFGLLYYIVKTGKDPASGFTSDEIKDAKKEMLLFAQNGVIFDKRVSKIPTKDLNTFASTELKAIKEAFVGSFVRELLPPPVLKSTDKNTLATWFVKNLYFNVIVNDALWYSKYFVLLHKEDAVPLKTAVTFKDNDTKLEEYRLNLKVLGRGYIEKLVGGQRGGQPNAIVIFSLFPDFPSAGIGALWLSMRPGDKISVEYLHDNSGIREIMQEIYESEKDVDEIKIEGKKIEFKFYADAFAAGVTALDWATLLKNILAGIDGEPSVSSAWKASEDQLREHILRKESEWIRNGEFFERIDSKGKTIAQAPADNCEFIGLGADECINFLTDCVTHKEFTDTCKKLVDPTMEDAFKINVPKPVKIERIQKINPKVAYAILKKFGFGEYETIDDDPVKGLHRYKVQSVAAWLQQIAKASGQLSCLPEEKIEANKCFQAAFGKGYEDIIGQIIKNNNLLDYLDILVEWVNANQQVLNIEEAKYPYGAAEWPEINKSFLIYNNVNPYKPALVRLRGLNVCLERMKGNILNGTMGFNAPSMISNIASVPLGLNMPLNRAAFTVPVPLGGLVGRMGGGGGVETELEKINKVYGAAMFEGIFKSLEDTMKNLSSHRNIKINDESTQKIRERIEKFKVKETALRKSIQNMLKKYELFQASQGQVNAIRIPDDRFPEILAKHSNLLHLSESYNKSAVNLINILQTIATALLSKVEENKETQTYERPMTMNYHYPPTPSFKK